MPEEEGAARARRLCVLTFNVLAPCYKRYYDENHRELPGRECDRPADWHARLGVILSLLDGIRPVPDIICLQEFWFEPEYQARFEDALAARYDFYSARRPQRDDGLATLVRRDSPAFSQRPVDADTNHVCQFPLGRGLERDRVGLMVSLPLAVPPGSPPRDLLLVNTHLTFPHCYVRRDTRTEQAETMADRVDAFAATRPSFAPALDVLVMGDFNGDPSGNTWKTMLRRGFSSCFATVCGAAARPVTHFDHLKQPVFVDHIFLKSFARPVPTRFLSDNRSTAALDRMADEKCSRPRVGKSLQNDFECDRRNSDEDIHAGESHRNGRLSQSPLRKYFSRKICSTSSCLIPASPLAVQDTTSDVRGAEKASHCLLPVAAQVYPESIPCGSWPAEFNASDHRPVGVQFLLG